STLEDISRYFEKIHDMASDEIMQLVTHPFLPLSDLDSPAMSAPPDDDHPAKCRVVYEKRVFDNPKARAGLAHSADRGCEIRLADELPHKLLIGDRMLALTPRNPRNHIDSGGMLLVHQGTLMDFLVMIFEAEWERAIPLQSHPALFSDDGLGLDDDERLIVEMLSAGAQMERIAATLGVHKRTADRRIDELKRRAGASTLYQLGIYAARHWLN
ncbi:hypothetical protein, partial [Planotetraspora phitsanulokensis]